MTNSKLKRIEMKFLLTPTLSSDVRDWARDHLGVDENCNADSGDTYAINTLYLDTPQFDLFHRTGVVGQTKHRIRRYGAEETLWLETKRKKNMVVRKSRTAVFESDVLARLNAVHLDRPVNDLDSVIDGDRWAGDWFLDRVSNRNLRPAIEIEYRRFARTTMIDGTSLRLTIDSDLHARPVDAWKVGMSSPIRQETSLPFGDAEILELKFDNLMPVLFKKLLSRFVIPVTSFSKYRTAIATAGIATAVPRSEVEMLAESAGECF